MIHVVIQQHSLSEFLLKDVEGINAIFIPPSLKITRYQKLLNKLYYHLSDHICGSYYPDELRKQFERIKEDDCLIVVLESLYALKVISRICSKVRNKVFYLWNPIRNLQEERSPYRLFNKILSAEDKLAYISKLGYRLATFDGQDAKNYGMQYVPQFYRDVAIQEPAELKCDFFFCGRDKGRREIIETIKKKVSSLGSTEFIVINDSHPDGLDYYDYIEKIKQTRVLCEVVQPNQSGLTVRAMEAMFWGKKLITNNSSIKKYDFYNDSNIFILKDNTKVEEIKSFLSKPYTPIKAEIINKYEVMQWALSLQNANL